MSDIPTEICFEIAHVTGDIRNLIEFKNKNNLTARVGCDNMKIELKQFLRTGIRYTYRYRNFNVDVEDFPTTKRYKSVNRLLHDLKIYRNNLQRKYTAAKKYENSKKKRHKKI